MDNFDLRKFITEGKLAESKKAYIQFEDGTTEERDIHQSVSDDKIKAMYGPGNVLDGRTVAKVMVGDSLDQEDLREASMRDKVDGLLAYYEAEMGEPADAGMEREIKSLIANGKSTDDVKSVIVNRDTLSESDLGDAVEFYMRHYDDNEMPEEIRQGVIDSFEDGKSLEWVKGQIKNGFMDMILPESLREQEDVLEPQDVPDTEEPEEETNEEERLEPEYSESIRNKNVKEVESVIADSIKNNMTDPDEFGNVNVKAVYKVLRELRKMPFYKDFLMDTDDPIEALENTGGYLPLLLGYNMNEEEIENEELLKDYGSFFERLFQSAYAGQDSEAYQMRMQSGFNTKDAGNTLSPNTGNL